MKISILAVLTGLNSLAFALIFLGLLFFRPLPWWFTLSFVFPLVVNTLLFLFFNRHARRNKRLGEEARNRWEIALFLASPLSFPAYFKWYIVDDEFRETRSST